MCSKSKANECKQDAQLHRNLVTITCKKPLIRYGGNGAVTRKEALYILGVCSLGHVNIPRDCSGYDNRPRDNLEVQSYASLHNFWFHHTLACIIKLVHCIASYSRITINVNPAIHAAGKVIVAMTI